MGNTGRVLAFLPAAAVLLPPPRARDVCPGKKLVLHLCASCPRPHTARSNCDGHLPNKQGNVLSEPHGLLTTDTQKQARYQEEYRIHLPCMDIAHMNKQQFQTCILFITMYLTAPNCRDIGSCYQVKSVKFFLKNKWIPLSKLLSWKVKYF